LTKEEHNEIIIIIIKSRCWKMKLNEIDVDKLYDLSIKKNISK
jgi:hypothetical protein